MMQFRRVSSCRLSIFLLHLLLAGFISPTIEAGNLLIPGQPLYDDGASLISSDGRFELGFFSPAGSGRRYIGIWYRNISQTPVWVANRLRPIDGRSGRLSLSGEGMLVIASNNSTTIWSSSTMTRLTNPEATLFDDGNFAVREAGNDEPDSFAWQSFDFPTDTLLPGMKLGWDLTTRLNRNLTSWASADDPSPGDYTLGIDLQGDPQLFLWSGTQQRHWRGGPWNGLHFSGGQGMSDPKLFNATFVVDPHQVIYSFNLLHPSTISVLVIDHSGVLQRRVWVDGARAWNVTWNVPTDSCDMMSICGVIAVGSPNAPPVQMCRCLPGFLVNNSESWKPGNTPYGCLRKFPSNCGNVTDVFFRMPGSKLSDTTTSVVMERRLSQDQCHESCLMNCSCTACEISSLDESESGCIMLLANSNPSMPPYLGREPPFTAVEPSSSRVPPASPVSRGGEPPASPVSRGGASPVSRGGEQPGNTNRPQVQTSNQSSARSGHLTAIYIGVPAALLIFLLVCIACCVCIARCVGRRRKRKSSVVKELEEKDLDLPLFDLDTVLAATNNFSAENKLGQGGFGPVYKGKLVDGQEIAVKRLSKTSTQGITEFKNEVVIIAKLQHQNLVRLLGCCIQKGERMLIYEYMPNGSLDAFLFAKRMLLDWKTRYNIIVGIARGLLYLHHDSRLKIIHRDLKTSNILLDKDNIPKISDFGLARIFGGDEPEINTRKVVGTYGYMSPEYAMNGTFSIKSDVFSFGVLLLEIVSGKKNREVYNSNYLNLLGHIWSLWKEDKSLQIADESIDHSFSVAEVMRCIKIGLLCVQERPQDRPTMPLVVIMLGSDSPIPEPKQPGFVAALDSSYSSIGMQYPISINDASNTTLEGR
ncbi:G-type lectin S-receptor-like serine/threonine-protein kinase At4g27290 isoform X2 [Zingiber officinale]|uniref:G-type lectin S-receptor-like serine/threonine-protein kinase At4g27290 isoform X2 n=1 Tax=Zingiber officinale TaxID=94328 RepID=UPI001C4B0C3A|nr:G-type lectin S-receptor-like serine/threonine-protein kinase At4g27290 isoform X2 [Zingiber officinale]